MLAVTLTATAATPAMAQQVAGSSSLDTKAQDSSKNSDLEFLDENGEPLPVEKQQELQVKFKDNPDLKKARQASAILNDSSSRKNSADRSDSEIVVRGQRPRGSVIGDIPSIQSFNPLDIRAYGASDIGDLIQVLGPQLNSNRGRDDGGPVVLLNGRRVSSFLEISRIPTEAIERMEVFPEELALKYGYQADQKVVNVITFERFSSQLGRTSYSSPTEGDRNTGAAGGGLLKIISGSRFTLDVDYDKSGALTEGDRNLQQPTGIAGGGRFRTLLPATDRLALNGTASGEVLKGVTSAINGRFETSSSRSLLGSDVSGVLARSLQTRATHLGISSDGLFGRWLGSFTANYDRTVSSTFTDIGTKAVQREFARAINAVADANVVFSGSVLGLPAGPLSSSFKLGGEKSDFYGQSSRASATGRTHLHRDKIMMLASFDLPLASPRGKLLPAFGDLSVNANVAAEALSDFGTLWKRRYGLSWLPTGRVGIIASVAHEESAPTIEQLGAPLVVTPNVRTFDFTDRAVVDISRIYGGNPDLRSDHRKVFTLGINGRPIAAHDLTLSLDYARTQIRDPVVMFPIALPAIETAFPDRFSRGIDGQLSRIDGRPLNFNHSVQEHIRWGINFVRPLGPLPPGMQNAKARFIPNGTDPAKALPPGAIILKPEPGSPEGRRFENASSRLIVSAYYTLTTIDRVTLRDGGPSLDLLDGFATGMRGGSPRHRVELQASGFKQGVGIRLSAAWQSGSLVRGLSQGATGGRDLKFSNLALVNAVLFTDLAQLLRKGTIANWATGLRIGLNVTNLFNKRPNVRDDTGFTPVAYQAPYLDPLGRSMNISLRKVF